MVDSQATRVPDDGSNSCGAIPEGKPGVLHDLFCQLSVPEAPIRDAEDGVGVAVVELGQSRGIAAYERGHQLCVRDPGHVGRHLPLRSGGLGGFHPVGGLRYGIAAGPACHMSGTVAQTTRRQVSFQALDARIAHERGVARAGRQVEAVTRPELDSGAPCRAART